MHHRSTQLDLVRRVSSILGAMALGLPLAAAPQQWFDQFGTPQVDSLEGIEPADGGAYFLVGATQGDLAGPSAGGSDVFIQKRDVDGNVLWQRQHGSSGGEVALTVDGDGAGGLFVAGATTGDFGGTHAGNAFDAFVLRLDNAGNMLWVRQLGTAANEQPTFVIADGSGGAIVGGRTGGSLGAPSFGSDDAWIARYDANGAQLWLTQFGSASDDVLEGAALDGIGGLFLGGSTYGDLSGSHAGNQDAFYGRMDLAGNLQSLVQLGTAEFDGVTDVLSDGAGGVYLAGETNDALVAPHAGGTDIFVAHLDAALGTLWSLQFEASSNEFGATLALDGAGGLLIVGGVLGSFGAMGSGGWFDPLIAQVDSAGNLLHGLQLPAIGFGIDTAHGVASDGVGGLIAVGVTEFGLYEYDTANGPQAWVGRFGLCDFDAPVNYCVGKPNSTGAGASIANAGSRYVANNDFALTVSACPSGQIGLFMMATGQKSTPFGDGMLCVGGNIQPLLPVQVTHASGTAALALDVTDPSSAASMIAPGSTWNFQVWYRDTASTGAGFNLSNGLSATFYP